jgi:ABC-type multidrug transport system permease subunit
MKQSVMLRGASLLSILLVTLHLADDIVRGFEDGGPSNLLAVPILVIWLYGALVLAERRSGYVIVLLASLFGAYIPFLHFRAAGGVAGGEIAGSSGAFFWVFTLVALGVSTVFSVILAAQGLFGLGWRRHEER